MGYIDRRGPLVYIAYDPKPPHLPIAVADSAQELADALGTTKNAIHSYICRAQKESWADPRFAWVRV